MNLEALQHVFTRAYEICSVSLIAGIIAVAISYGFAQICNSNYRCRALLKLKKWIYASAFVGTLGGALVMFAVYGYRRIHGL